MNETHHVLHLICEQNLATWMSGMQNKENLWSDLMADNCSGKWGQQSMTHLENKPTAKTSTWDLERACMCFQRFKQ